MKGSDFVWIVGLLIALVAGIFWFSDFQYTKGYNQAVANVKADTGKVYIQGKLKTDTIWCSRNIKTTVHTQSVKYIHINDTINHRDTIYALITIDTTFTNDSLKVKARFSTTDFLKNGIKVDWIEKYMEIKSKQTDTLKENITKTPQIASETSLWTKLYESSPIIIIVTITAILIKLIFF